MSFSRGRLLQLFVDGLIILLAFALAYAMRFEGVPPRFYLKQLLLVAPYLILLRIGIFPIFGVYRLVWRYIAVRDLPRIVSAVATGTAAMVALRLSFPWFLKATGLVFNHGFSRIPWGVLAAELVLTTVGLISVRLLWRVITERRSLAGKQRSVPRFSGRKRALLAGAGSAGVMIAKEVAANPSVGFEIIGFLDDDPTKRRTIIHGHKVVGTTNDLPRLAEQLDAELVIITMANAPAAAVRQIVHLTEEAGLPVQIIPGLHEILSGRINISKVRDVAIEDLLGRAPVQLEEDAIRASLTGRRILVTGAGGSIGSEIVRQVSRYQPKQLIVVDQAENCIFHLLRELKGRGFDAIPRIGNVTDRERMEQVIAEVKPEVIFHAAAHKHVPLMEDNPGEAIRNNVLGSRTVADLADKYGVEAFVMVSTDKAVNPTSVMGASKRLAEIYVQALATRSKTRFLTVRFGNVLGSEGSVVPLFKEQIARGGPVTVTDPEMKRYFMTIPEASQLVLQAGTMGEGGEIFILEMGEPIKIVNLARDLIRLSGYRPDEEIQIEFSGIRPGEKLYEEINLSTEKATKTKHPRIWVGKHQQRSYDEAAKLVDELVSIARQVPADKLLQRLQVAVPEFMPERLAAKAVSSASSRVVATSAPAHVKAATAT